MWVLNLAKQLNLTKQLNWAKGFSGNVLSERDFQVFLSKELARLPHRTRVLNVACFEVQGLAKLEPADGVAVVTHIVDLLKAELRKHEVLAHTQPSQIVLCFPDASPDEAHQILSHMQLEVQAAMQLYHLSVSMNAALFSFDKPFSLLEVTTLVDGLLAEANAAGQNVMLQEVAVAPKKFKAPFAVQPSQFDKHSSLV
jgi:GGDEF domain-containing protein